MRTAKKGGRGGWVQVGRSKSPRQRHRRHIQNNYELARSTRHTRWQAGGLSSVELVAHSFHCKDQLIGLREKLQENPYFMGKSIVSCTVDFPLSQPIEKNHGKHRFS